MSCFCTVHRQLHMVCRSHDDSRLWRRTLHRQHMLLSCCGSWEKSNSAGAYQELDLIVRWKYSWRSIDGEFCFRNDGRRWERYLRIPICLQAWVAYNGGTLGDAPASVQIAIAKCSLPWRTAFLRAVMGNWIVCMSILMATGSSSLASKMVAIFFPISAFVMLGLEHSIANLFLVPLGIMRGGKVTIMEFFWKNLLPVTLGNIVGGAICVALSYSCIHGSFLDKEIQQKWGK